MKCIGIKVGYNSSLIIFKIADYSNLDNYNRSWTMLTKKLASEGTSFSANPIMQLETGDTVYHKIAGEGFVREIYTQFMGIEKIPIEYALVQFKYETSSVKTSELTI